MTDVERAFVEAIVANREDDEARQVYADWLDERGDPRGEYLRLEVQLRRIPQRLAELGAAIDPSWIEQVTRRYEVVLRSSGPNKISAIKEIREVTGLGLKECKELVDGASARTPPVIVTDFDRGRADAVAAKLVAIGAEARVLPVAPRPGDLAPAEPGELVTVTL